jgi:hypothetical protein
MPNTPNTNEQWKVEEIAGVDLALKRLANAHVVAMAVDRLFFAQNEKGTIKKLKDSGHVLVSVKNEVPDDLRSKWVAGLGAQLRASVDRAKKNAGQK